MSASDIPTPDPASPIPSDDASDTDETEEPEKRGWPDYDEDGNPMPQFRVDGPPGVRWFTVKNNEGGGGTREVAIGRSSTTFDYVLLKRTGRVTESPLYDILSLPYASPFIWPGALGALAWAQTMFVQLHMAKGSSREPSLEDLEAVGILRRHGAVAEFGTGEMLLSCGNAACGNNEHGILEGEPRFKICGGCNLQAYCSAECQHQDWKSTHKKECKMIKARKFQDLEVFRRTGMKQWAQEKGMEYSEGPDGGYTVVME
ncbi:hypothetical protein RQP46_001574 [Phenoliferia psychrophenolica]